MNINAVGVKLEIIVEPQKCESIIRGGIFWYKEVCCEKMTWILAPEEESLCIIKLSTKPKRILLQPNLCFFTHSNFTTIDQLFSWIDSLFDSR